MSRSPGRDLVLLLLILSASLAPMLVQLGLRGPRGWMESVVVLSSQETWLRQHAGESQAWLIPTKNGVPRIVKPPLVVWMNMLAWVDLDPESFETRPSSSSAPDW